MQEFSDLWPAAQDSKLRGSKRIRMTMLDQLSNCAIQRAMVPAAAEANRFSTSMAACAEALEQTPQSASWGGLAMTLESFAATDS